MGCLIPRGARCLANIAHRAKYSKPPLAAIETIIEQRQAVEEPDLFDDIVAANGSVPSARRSEARASGPFLLFSRPFPASTRSFDEWYG